MGRIRVDRKELVCGYDGRLETIDCFYLRANANFPSIGLSIRARKNK